jgi:filamentous hemagglutinin family protein
MAKNFGLNKQKLSLLNLCRGYFTYKRYLNVCSRLASVSIRCLVGSSFLYCHITVVSKVSAYAQVIPDNTLSTPTRIEQSNTLYEISGGKEVGNNLFHSFQDFSVPEGYISRFINNNQSIQNVIGRVTGKSRSEIFGRLEAGGTSPNFNLFLLNPNGIIFGPNASLNLNGSFVATTADALQFDDQGLFSALDPTEPSLLTINPSAFIFSQLRPQPISYVSENQPVVGLSVPKGKSILLVGGDLELNGVNLNATDGRVELGGLAEPGTITLNSAGGNLSLSFPEVVAKANVFINESLIDVSGDSSGSIVINAKNIKLENSRLESDLFTGGDAGEINLNASDDITLDGSAVFSAVLPGAIGDSSNITIRSKTFSLLNGGRLLTLSAGEGSAGNISIDVDEKLLLSGQNDRDIPSQIGTLLLPGGKGKSGNILIKAASLSLVDGATTITTGSGGEGDAGDISIFVDGDVTLENFSDLHFPAQINSGIQAGGKGNGGNIYIQASNLSLIGGAAISSFVSGPDSDLNFPGGIGKGGDIHLNISNSIFISGAGDFEFPRGIFANVSEGGMGASGNIYIKTMSFHLLDSTVAVSNPQGQAGDLTIAANTMTLDNGIIEAETGGDGSSVGANITLAISDLLKLENKSLISARASGDANGGNIQIDTPILLALPSTGLNGSDIIANAIDGEGGNITINAQGVFGIEERKAIDGNQTNDIDASSQFGRSGQVQVNTTTDPNQGLVELPTTVIDPNTLVAQNACKRGAESEFTSSGRGGLPANPNQDLSNGSAQVGLVEPASAAPKAQTQNQSPTVSVTPQQSTAKTIAPAQGWVYNEKGEIVLVAYNPNVSSPQRLKDNTACTAQ